MLSASTAYSGTQAATFSNATLIASAASAAAGKWAIRNVTASGDVLIFINSTATATPTASSPCPFQGVASYAYVTATGVVTNLTAAVLARVAADNPSVANPSCYIHTSVAYVSDGAVLLSVELESNTPGGFTSGGFYHFAWIRCVSWLVS